MRPNLFHLDSRRLDIDVADLRVRAEAHRDINALDGREIDGHRTPGFLLVRAIAIVIAGNRLEIGLAHHRIAAPGARSNVLGPVLLEAQIIARLAVEDRQVTAAHTLASRGPGECQSQDGADRVDRALAVFNLLLQVMDHGTLTDNNGRKADFRHVILVMTTNAGAEMLTRRSIGFANQDHSTDGMEIINKTFTPEFRNRLDGIIQFSALNAEVINHVVDKFLTELQAQLDEKQVVLHVDDEAKLWLAEHGYDENMGARPMGRLIQEKIKKGLAEEILFGRLSSGGGEVHVKVSNDDLAFEFETEQPEPVE